MAIKGQFKMDSTDCLNGWVVSGPKGPIPSTFRMTYEAVDAIWAKRKGQGYEATIFVAKLDLREKVKS